MGFNSQLLFRHLTQSVGRRNEEHLVGISSERVRIQECFLPNASLNLETNKCGIIQPGRKLAEPAWKRPRYNSLSFCPFYFLLLKKRICLTIAAGKSLTSFCSVIHKIDTFSVLKWNYLYESILYSHRTFLLFRTIIVASDGNSN